VFIKAQKAPSLRTVVIELILIRFSKKGAQVRSPAPQSGEQQDVQLKFLKRLKRLEKASKSEAPWIKPTKSTHHEPTLQYDPTLSTPKCLLVLLRLVLLPLFHSHRPSLAST
jgi:hypothetical protein